jgi:hypothetical protein
MSNQNPTNATGSSQYVVQNLDQRYIKSQVLDDYINARQQEFGTRWMRQVGTDPIARSEETFGSMLTGAKLGYSRALLHHSQAETLGGTHALYYLSSIQV